MSGRRRHDRPPDPAVRLLARVMGRERGRDAAWDLFDLYRLRVDTGSEFGALLRFWFDVVSIAVRPGLWNRRRSSTPIMFSAAMLSNHVRHAVRRIRTRPGFAGLNAVGLGVGLACVLLILLYVRHELSYDLHHPGSDRLYRVTVEYAESGTHWAPIGPPVGPAFEEAFPEVERLARFFPSSGAQIFRNGDRQFYESEGGFADSTFFDVFGYELLHGDPETVLLDPTSFVVSEELAQKYFGRVDIVGETLENPGFDDVTITGVFRTKDVRTHLPVDFLYPMSKFYQGNEDWLNSARTWAGFLTYVRLRTDAALPAVEQRLPSFVDSFYEGITEGPASEAGRLILQPVEDIHLHSALEKEYRPNGDVTYVWTFSIVAAFVLLIAIVNFINLATARASARMREVAVRKSFGARRSQVAAQMMAESMVHSLLGLTTAVVLILAALPVFNGLTGLAFTWRIILDPAVSGALVATTFVVALLAGVYPALLVSAFRPVSGLQGDRGVSGGRAFLRKGLVVFQFSASIFLIAAAAVIWQQLDYVRSANLGFDKDGVMYVHMTDAMSESMRENPTTIRDALHAIPGIETVSHATDVPGERYSMEGFHLDTMLEEDAEMMRVAWASDHEYVDALGLDLVAGRTFSREAPADTSAWVVNEAAAARLGLGSEAVVGRVLNWNEYSGPIVGVVRDFNISSMHRTVEPLVIPLRPGWGGKLIIRYSGVDVAGMLDEVRAAIDGIVPGQLFEYTFLDDQMDALYRQETKMRAIISWFSAIAVLVACLGLFGLAAYAVTRRTTEIGIRKVLGARTTQIMTLVSREFVILVGIAFACSAPLAWVILSRWLDTFAYRIDLSVWPFLAAGLAALVFAVVTVGGHALRAASLNPVTAIKRE